MLMPFGFIVDKVNNLAPLRLLILLPRKICFGNHLCMSSTVQKYYNQPQIAVEEQIRLLKSEGLSFENECRAKHLLNNISMLRLKSYLKPLRQQNSRRL